MKYKTWLLYTIGTAMLYTGCWTLQNNPEAGYHYAAGIGVTGILCGILIKPRPRDYFYFRLGEEESLSVACARLLPMIILVLFFGILSFTMNPREAGGFLCLAIALFYTSFIRVRIVWNKDINLIDGSAKRPI
jgi:hypothetical protein